MRILYVTPTFPPDNGWGGIGTYVHHITQGLLKNGHTPIVLCVVQKGMEKKRYLRDDGVLVLSLLSSHDEQLIREEVLYYVAELYQNNQFDIVEFPEYGAPGLLFQKAFPECKTVIRLHGDSLMALDGNRSSLTKFLKKFDMRKLQKTKLNYEIETIKLAKLITAPTNWTIKMSQNRGWIYEGQNCIVIANPISRISGFLERITCESEPLTIIFFGRLDYRKGADLIPKIIRTIHLKYPNIEYKIIGQSGYIKNTFGIFKKKLYSEWIKSSLSESELSKVNIVGGKTLSDIVPILPKNGIACFQSTWETFGYTHVEMMYCGYPTVIASGGGAQELGIDKCNALFCKRNPKQIVKAIFMLIENRKMRIGIGEAARSYVLNEFSAEKVSAKMVHDVYYKNFNYK